MTIALVLVAVLAPPTPSAPVIHYGQPVVVSAPTQTAYTPRRCGDLIAEARLVGKPITDYNLGQVMAQALYDHGVKPGAFQELPLEEAIIDFAGCFRRK